MRELPSSTPLVRLESLWPWLHKSPHLLAKAIRFALVGLLNGCIFAAVTALLVSGLGVDPIPASVAGYCLSVPLGFLGHRQFSFRSRGHWLAEAGLTKVQSRAILSIPSLGPLTRKLDHLLGRLSLGAQYYAQAAA